MALALISPSTAYVPDTLSVTFIDVGQGDSILVQAPNGHAMLVDAGESWASRAVSAGLEAEEITRLEYVVATHDHDDHIGGMVGVLPSVAVGEFMTNGVPASTLTAINLRTYLSTHAIPTDAAAAGETLALDPANVTVTVLNPPATPGTDQNEASVVLRLVFGSQSFLLAGDAGTTAEGWMLASGRPVAARFLKVGHHGSSTATGSAFVAAVDPAVAVIEAGAFNSYGHPSQNVVKRLQDSGAAVYSTSESGTVRITATRTGYTLDATDGPELPVTVPGASLPPTDPDFDGDFEDVNGNQRRDFADVVMVFNQLNWITTNEPVVRFDFNGNGRMDFADVVLLFNTIGDPIVTPTPTPTTIPTTTMQTPTPTPTPQVYTLEVTDLDLQNEWVSIRNTGVAPIQMAGCTISDESIHVYTFPSFVLAAGATVTVYTGNGTNTATDLFWGLGSSVWNNTGDTATLKRPDGSVISSLTRP